MTVTMTPAYWQVSEAIAQELSAAKSDVNELRKVVSYLCWLRSRSVSVNCDRLFEYLAALVEHGEVRSNQTSRYYKDIEHACTLYLAALQPEDDALIQILGWAGRLHR